MSTDPKVALLAEVPLFAQLGSRSFARVGALADVLDLPGGRVLMRQGETGAEAIVIVHGSASIEIDGTVVAERGPGSILGEMALISHQPRTATVTLTSDSEVLVIGRREFDALMHEMPSVRAQIMECLALRLMAAEPSTGH